MTDWFASMDWFERVYWLIAIPMSLVFILQLILTFLGADGIGEADFDGDLGSDLSDAGSIDDTGGAGFQILTIRNFIAFLTIFGWSGLMMIDFGASKWLTVLVSFLLGLMAMLMVAGIFYLFYKSVESGTMNVKKAVGGVGEVYIPLKAKRGNIGKVQINIQGSMREMSALTDESDDLGTGTVVQVIQVINDNILLVKKV